MKKRQEKKEAKKTKKYYINEGIKLTPNLAAQWLEKTLGNRSINQAKVDDYAESMKMGKWHRNGATMAWDWDGNFRDGHHRCWAVVESNVTIVVDVAYNINPNATRTIDTGLRRTNKDTIVMEERILYKDKDLKIKNAGVIAASLRFIEAHFNGENIYIHIKLKNDKCHQLYRENPEIIDSASFVCRTGVLCSKTICCALHYIFSRVKSDKELVDDFFNRFITGTELEEGSPILALRKKFILTKQDSRAEMSKKFTLACIIRAWEAFKNGKTLKSIIYNPDKLPKITKRKRK